MKKDCQRVRTRPDLVAVINIQGKAERGQGGTKRPNCAIAQSSDE